MKHGEGSGKSLIPVPHLPGSDLVVIRGYVLRIAVFGVFLGEIIPFRPFRFIMRGKYFRTLRPSISRRKSHFVHSDRLENLDFDI